MITRRRKGRVTPLLELESESNLPHRQPALQASSSAYFRMGWSGRSLPPLNTMIGLPVLDDEDWTREVGLWKEETDDVGIKCMDRIG